VYQAEEPAILLECESEKNKLLCSSQKLVEYILKKIEFNDIDNSSESTLIVSFIIEKDGSLSTIENLRGKTTIERSNLFELLQNTPKWIPAKDGGKLVRFKYKLPIRVHYQ
jgi:hypothetical protein